MPAHGTAVNQQVVVGRWRQRLGQQDASLQGIKVVIELRHKVFNAKNHAGILVADFNAHSLGTL